MRQGTNSRRLRNRNGRRQHSSSKQHTFDSSGPDVKVRGTASQVFEKYLTLARDAMSSGNRVAAENFYQHAEHYYRILNFDGNSSGADGGGGAKPRANGGGGNSDAGRDTAVAANSGSKDSDGFAVADDKAVSGDKAVAGDNKEQPAASDGTPAEAGNSDPEKTPSA